MWARTAEIMLGLWIVLSPFIFRHPADATAWWVNDFTCGTLVILCALISFWAFRFWEKVRLAHLAIVPIALCMIGFAFVTASVPPASALQNYVIVGLLLLMLALVPNDAEAPPEEWVEYIAKKIDE